MVRVLLLASSGVQMSGRSFWVGLVLLFLTASQAHAEAPRLKVGSFQLVSLVQPACTPPGAAIIGIRTQANPYYVAPFEDDQPIGPVVAAFEDDDDDELAPMLPIVRVAS